jgi:ZIP family zinc transporter
MIDDWQKIIFLTLLAGLAMPIGAMLANLESLCGKRLQDEIRHAVVAFGGGALLSAVALVLIPKGIESLGLVSIISSFGLGGVLVGCISMYIKKSGSKASNFIAMLTDFVPEALALGTSVAMGEEGLAVLLAIMIGLQNLPEGFSTYRDLIESGWKGKHIIYSLIIVSFLGPISGLLGFYVLVDYPHLISATMLFSSGGILFLVFQDIIPDSKLERSSKPAFGALLGFLLGLVGHVLIH